MELKVDESRLGRNSTGIYVRAKHNDSWGSFDIYELNKESLVIWLTDSGCSNPMAENTVGILLGHGHIHEPNG